MNEKEADELARQWWVETLAHDAVDRAEPDPDDDESGQTAFTYVYEVMDTRPELMPMIIRSLVREAQPPWGVPYIGTSILESFAQSNPEQVLEAVRAASLSTADLVTVLSGMYPDWLSQLHLQDKMSDLLSAEQLSWLLDSGRREGL